jgi:hypothetical protein
MNRDNSPPRERYKPGSNRRQLIGVFLTVISLLTVLFYTTESNFFIRIPQLSGTEPASESSTWPLSNGQIRPIQAPRSNFWGGLTQEETTDVVNIVERSKVDAELASDAVV